jgi:hypothetical protein
MKSSPLNMLLVYLLLISQPKAPCQDTTRPVMTATMTAENSKKPSRICWQEPFAWQKRLFFWGGQLGCL